MSAYLPSNAFSLLHKHSLGPTAIVATVGPDGCPHTAPFGSLYAVTQRILRFGCDRKHDTYANIVRDGRVVVCFIAPPNIAVSIRGKARVVKERMDLLNTDSIVEIEIDDVKDDLLPGATIESAVTYSVTEDLKPLLFKYMTEIQTN